jgi:hypothetical protein
MRGPDDSKRCHVSSASRCRSARTDLTASFSNAELPENPVQDVVGHYRADDLAQLVDRQGSGNGDGGAE